mmetsp:Transcript_69198/g.104316  ORF Transcript_69198/g.104316 Transcript_69198/m.104316 type:complete len:240 (-) Transcript_69198:1909-2628(-)
MQTGALRHARNRLLVSHLAGLPPSSGDASRQRGGATAETSPFLHSGVRACLLSIHCFAPKAERVESSCASQHRRNIEPWTKPWIKLIIDCVYRNAGHHGSRMDRRTARLTCSYAAHDSSISVAQRCGHQNRGIPDGSLVESRQKVRGVWQRHPCLRPRNHRHFQRRNKTRRQESSLKLRLAFLHKSILLVHSPAREAGVSGRREPAATPARSESGQLELASARPNFATRRLESGESERQ